MREGRTVAYLRVLALAALAVLVWFGSPPAGARPAIGTALVAANLDGRPPGGASRTLEGSSAVTIAIVDTGVARLPALAPGLGAGVDLLGGNSLAVGDGNGHGTEMASIAAARPTAWEAVSGVCSGCTILPVRVVGDTGTSTTALVAAGIRWAAAAHARVINVSLSTADDDPELAGAIEAAVAAGSVVVVAAGNAGSSDPAAEGYPAAASPDAITVAGADPSGHLYPWSNHGPWVELAAPGALPALSRSGKQVAAVGTSAAAAYVSGLAGLILSANPALTPAQVETILTSTGTPIQGLDVASGRVVDAQAALAAAPAD